ncbi:unnamed product [Ostreococcus tauri]|uniref:Unnamed product n=1 Tax=Ostreococcus tauri TaxID=70448 RepID=A0A090LZ55_OSTTA|nr:unnamed product [Ostreococcus tauri]CEF97211.1 unnamed product [Ostreococcus tauri]|eukprot:XP_022838549.1 unnamed product [Ostreococcus tauri]
MHRALSATSTSTSTRGRAGARARVRRRAGGRGRFSVARAAGGPGDGDGGDGRDGEKPGMDWDGAWKTFKKEFVGDDAKMPNDYVEFKSSNKRRAPDAEAKRQIYDDEDRVLNVATSQKTTAVGLIAVASLLFVFVFVIGPPPSDGRCSLPWC